MNTQMRIIFFSILIIFGLIVFGLFRACRSCSATEKQITVELSIGSDELTIINTSSNSYSDIRIKINGDYHYKTYGLNAFETKSIDYSNFSKSDGTKFTPILQAVKNVYIAGDKNGDKYWGYFETKKY